MIKQILDEIAADNGKLAKLAILGKYKDNELLKQVLYLADSKRIKFYIKQIPEYTKDGNSSLTLDEALKKLAKLINREVTGNDAIEYLKDILSSVLSDDAYVIERIIQKDLKIGMDSGINKVIPNLIEETPYMGAKSFSEKLAKDIFNKSKKAFSQIKMDGRYCNAIICGGEVELVSRQGETTFVGNAPFLKELELLNDVVLNGELTIDGYDRYTANGMVASIVDIEGKREERGEVETLKKINAFDKKHGLYIDAINGIRFTVWDMITTDEYFNKKTSIPYHERLKNLENVLLGNQNENNKVCVVENVLCESYSDAMAHFQTALAKGLEGTILKAYDGAWKDGKPNWQVKMKLEMSLDLKIVGFNYGTKGTKNENVISTIRTESSCGLLKTNPSGMNEEMMKFVTENQEKLMGSVVEIRCCGLSQDSDGNWSTLHPSVVELRTDKNTCDSLESAKEIEHMVKTLV